MADTTAQTGYAPLNGLNMYYEIHGAGQPLLLMHGGFMTIDALGPLLPALAQTRQVIAVELEGHGRTADLDRPLSYEQMAEDVAGLFGHLGIARADVFGFSLGGITGLRLAIRYPELVRKLVAASVIYSIEGYYNPSSPCSRARPISTFSTAPISCCRSSRRFSTRPCRTPTDLQ